MANKTSTAAATAFVAGKSYHCGNTSTDGTVMLLYGHKVAWFEVEAGRTRLMFSACGFPTKTTKERLNAILWAFGKQSDLYMKNGVLCCAHRDAANPEAKPEVSIVSCNQPFSMGEVLNRPGNP